MPDAAPNPTTVRAPRPLGLDDRTLAVVTLGPSPDDARYLAAVVARLEHRHFLTAVETVAWPSADAVSSAVAVADLAARCDVVLLGIVRAPGAADGVAAAFEAAGVPCALVTADGVHAFGPVVDDASFRAVEQALCRIEGPDPAGGAGGVTCAC